jgi:hypothetical protein
MIRAVIAVIAGAAVILAAIARAGAVSARSVRQAAELEAARLRGKVEAYELLHGPIDGPTGDSHADLDRLREELGGQAAP